LAARLSTANYRAVLDALSYPGSGKKLAFENGDQGFIALLASLLDQAVTLADPNGLVHQDNITLLQTPMDRPEKADFIVCRGREKPSFEPKLGTLPSPELSATIVILVEKIADTIGKGDLTLRLSGPGVNGVSHCAITGLDEQWLRSREQWVSHFPLGVDILLVDDVRVMALPRTTKVEIV